MSNRYYFDIQNPCPVGDKTDISKEVYVLTETDIKNLLKYFSENYIVCQYHSGDSLFTELLLKKDVIVEAEECDC